MGETVDFSKASKVRDSLKEDLLNRLAMKNALQDDELDQIAAAGKPELQHKEKDKI